jgi:hypothetical protein
VLSHSSGTRDSRISFCIWLPRCLDFCGMPNAILRYMLQGMRSARCMHSVCSNVSFVRVADTMFGICALGDQLVVIQCYAVQSCSVLTIAVVWQIAIPVLRSLVNTNEQLRHSCVAKSLCNRSACLYFACSVLLFGVVVLYILIWSQ